MRGKISLLMSMLLLSACTGPWSHHNKILYRCAYRNITTKKVYVVEGRDRFAAVYKAQKLCLKGPVEWRCYFDVCEERKAGSL